MKKINELTKDECQDFLNETFDDDSIDFNRLIFDPDFTDDESCGIEYSVSPENKKYIVSFSNPDLITWLYKHDYDLFWPLQQLSVDYTEIDETNSILFEYAMNVNKIVNTYTLPESNDELEKLNEIKHLQKDLIGKL